ncbi:MAG: 4-hydroxy-tetrahydrodipicolinate synthase [Alphaproteobacteria bacterium]
MTTKWTDTFRGSICALVTPFTDRGELDEDALRELVEWHAGSGTHGLVICGTTGESPTLGDEEHIRAIRIAVETAKGRLPVIAGTGVNHTAHAIKLTRESEEAGADAAILAVPYYNKPTQEGIYQHYKAVHDNCGLPVLTYNIPGRSSVDMSVDTLARLAELPRLIGNKDATGGMSRASMERQACGPDFVRLSGEDPTTLGFMAHGGHGCVSVTANVAPAECAAFQNACLSGDFRTALEYQDRLMPLHRALFVETNPGPAKFALSVLGKCRNVLRLPLVPVAPQTEQVIREAMAAAGINVH